MQYGMLHPMGKVFYLSQLAADQKELVSDKICDITLHTNEKPGVEDAYSMNTAINSCLFKKISCYRYKATTHSSNNPKQITPSDHHLPALFPTRTLSADCSAWGGCDAIKIGEWFIESKYHVVAL